MTAKKQASSIDVLVTGVAAGLVLAFVLAGVLLTEDVAATGHMTWGFLAKWFGWLYVLTTFGFVVFSLLVAFTRLGGIRLSEEDEAPEFSTVSWVAMMFAIGVGIGLIFYGAAEPVLLWADPPPEAVEPKTRAAAHTGIEYALFHWCLHPWAFFGVTGLVLAYSTYRKGRSALVSETFWPLFGERASADRLPGRVVNILVIIATLFGNAVTLARARRTADLAWDLIHRRA